MSAVSSLRPQQGARSEARVRSGPHWGQIPLPLGKATLEAMKKKPAEETEDLSQDSSADVQAESFGSWLRRQREGREIDLREIADTSKISLAYLQAFEDDRFDILPAPVFAKGFLRQYARYVGLDAEEVVNFYLTASQADEEEEDSTQIASQKSRRAAFSRRYVAAALAIAAFLLLIVWGLSRWNEWQGQQTPPSSAAPPADPHPEDLAAPAGAIPADNPAAPVNAGTVAAEAEEEPSPVETAAGQVVPEVAAEPPLRVILDFAGECWVEASVDGQRAVAEQKVQGESLQLTATELIELKLGRPDLARLLVNGRSWELGEGTSVRHLRIDLEAAGAIPLAGEASDP